MKEKPHVSNIKLINKLLHFQLNANNKTNATLCFTNQHNYKHYYDTITRSQGTIAPHNTIYNILALAHKML